MPINCSKKIIFVASSVLLTQQAAADLSLTMTAASDYIFDGVSLNDGKGTPQFSIDYAHDSGFYAGTWASNVDLGENNPADVEVDLYGGYSAEISYGFGYDLGAAQYMYLGAPSEADYLELYAGIYTPVDFTLYVWGSDDDDVFGGKAVRVKAIKGFELNDELRLETEITYVDQLDLDQGDSNFVHYRVGVSTSLEVADIDLSIHETDQDGNPDADTQIAMTATRTFDL